MNADQAKQLMFESLKSYPQVLADAEVAIQDAASQGLGEVLLRDTSDQKVVYYEQGVAPINPMMRLIERTFIERGFGTNLFQKEVSARDYRGRHDKFECEVETFVKVTW